ncbi:hypothetical protein MBUL_01263 [Methylobacterium bullatum]|uniref:Uncharacterized protein n=1 Tax=Methylobacterium bullatum TaxID=570505 RepID=A0A679IWW6_9HYPH|nr:hypothetical protein MBUL_01263 [Methylobacterium bullatum]
MSSRCVVREVHDTNGATGRPLMALAFILAACVTITAAVAVKHGLSWPASVGMVYGLSAFCQIAYLGLVVAREWDGAPGRST